jgi:hypothetical protein
MDPERTVDTGDIVELGLHEAAAPAPPPVVSDVPGIQAVVVGPDHGTLEDVQLVDAADVLPVERFLQAPAIINQHDDDGAAVEP